ncbi:MAG: hypothetical protein WD830_00540 [Chloroflexota bacterium]
MVSLALVTATLDRSFWLGAMVGTVIALVVLGVPTAVVPNPFFVRMTPTQPLDVAFWLISSPLIGLTLATYVAKPAQWAVDRHSGAGGAPTSIAGIGAFLAIGCPICNKIVVGLLGVSGALTVFAPLQPAIGVASVALLAVSLAYRLRQRTRDCPRCTSVTGAIGLPADVG